MTDSSPETRLLHGSTIPRGPSMASAPQASGEISFGQILGVLRRRYRVILLMTMLGTGVGGFLASREPPTYHAGAVLRVADERRALTGDMETPDPAPSRTMDRIASLAQLVKSRSVLGAVVDSLGLQLQSRTPEFLNSQLSQVRIDPRVSNDSIVLEFKPDRVTARYGGRVGSGAYGQALSLGPLRFAVDRAPAVPTAVLGIASREGMIDWLLGTMVVAPRPETDLIDVGFISSDPRQAQQIVNLTVKSFQALDIQSAREKSRRRREFLQEQLAQNDSTLARAQGELAAFRSRQQIASSETKINAAQNALITLDARRSELETDRNTYATLLKQLRSGNDEARAEALRALAGSPALGDNPQIGGLYQRLNTYQYRLDSMTTGQWAAAPTNPDVVALRKLIRTSQDELTQAASAHLGSIDARLNALGDLRRSSGQSIQLLPAMVEEEMRLTSRVQALGNIGDQIRTDYQRARMAEAVEAGEVDIVDLADLPYATLWTAASIKFLIGLILGLLLGGGLAFVLEALNTSIRRPEDIEAALHIPGLAVIPRLTSGPAVGHRRLGGLVKGKKALQAPRSAAEAIGTVAQPFSIGTEAFRMLRTSLIWSDGADQLKTLMITSAAPGEGKTLTAANLSASFAHDGLQVLLVDCDVRRPRLHGLFRVPRSPGLLDLLAPPNGGNGSTVRSLSFSAHEADGDDPLAHALRPTPIRGLTLLSCGALPTSASNLLSGVRMRSLLQELNQRFDLVILDTPPVLATADAGILGSLADGVLLVIRAGQTDRSAAQRAYQQLAQGGARVVGAVLNDPKGEVSQYGDYYYPYEYVAEKE
ncbi:MAG: polysaccharide biosynthesis tyrosine autokinase [Gemmatimonadales bacterium]